MLFITNNSLLNISVFMNNNVINCWNHLQAVTWPSLYTKIIETLNYKRSFSFLRRQTERTCIISGFPTLTR